MESEDSQLIKEDIVGVATGGDGGDMSPPGSKFRGDAPQKSRFLNKILCIFVKIFRFSNSSKIKWPKSEDKSEFGGRWL